MKKIAGVLLVAVLTIASFLAIVSAVASGIYAG